MAFRRQNLKAVLPDKLIHYSVGGVVVTAVAGSAIRLLLGDAQYQNVIETLADSQSFTTHSYHWSLIHHQGPIQYEKKDH